MRFGAGSIPARLVAPARPLFARGVVIGAVVLLNEIGTLASATRVRGIAPVDARQRTARGHLEVDVGVAALCIEGPLGFVLAEPALEVLVSDWSLRS